MYFIVKFIIVIFAIFAPMAAIEAARPVFRALPDMAILIILWAFLTAAGSYIYLRWEAGTK